MAVGIGWMFEEGRVVFAGTRGHEVYDPIGTVHGGYKAILMIMDR